MWNSDQSQSSPLKDDTATWSLFLYMFEWGWNQVKGFLAPLFRCILLGWIEDRALSQHIKAAGWKSWFKPWPNQSSTFINRCHYSPAAVWQMALWEIGFYGRSSFISNFSSHLMRSSRSSQIHFAVWILIGLCTLSILFPALASLPFSFFLNMHCNTRRI